MSRAGRKSRENAPSGAGDGGSGVTRRDLLRGASLAAAAPTVLAPALKAIAEGEATEVRVQGPQPVEITLKVNGKDRKVSVEPRETLLDVLRLPLDTTGPKPACDRGACGACTVLLAGKPVYACTILAVDVDGSHVTTAEGLDVHVAFGGRPLLDAFVAKDAMQCGFCTPGMLVACKAAIDQHGPSLTLEQARAATAGNLCRCGTYPHVLQAALSAAAGMSSAKPAGGH